MEDMITRAKAAIIASSDKSSVYVGTDSVRYKKKGQWFARYSTVVILHKDSKHGGQIFHRNVELPDYGGLKQRMLNEVQQAIEVATEIIEVIGNRKMEIHLDLNSDPKHGSNVAVKEALGWVKGSLGIDAKIKPFSFAASSAADHMVKH